MRALLKTTSCNFFFCRQATKNTGLSYCMDLVRRCDYENFLSTLLLPGDLRSKAFVLRAFQVELAQIKEAVKEKNLALIRMQFWQDAIQSIYKKDQTPSSQLLNQLRKVIVSDNLQKVWFMRILETRREQLSSDLPHPSLQHLEQASENIHSSLLLLLLQAAGLTNVDADHTASHLGKAQGLVLSCRSVPHHASKGLVFLPQDLMIKHKVSQSDVINNSNQVGLTEVIYEIASQANSHLELAIGHWNKLPKTAQLIFLSATPTKRYLKRLQKYNFDPGHSRLGMKDSLLALNLVVNKLKRKL